MAITTDQLTLVSLRAAYAAGTLTPTALCERLLPAVAASRGVFIAPATEAEVYARCR